MFVCPECGDAHPSGGFCTRDGTRLVDAAGDALLGTQIGAYQVARLIGAGGMGRVYKGVNPSIGSRVAVKVLSRDCAHNPELVERFFAEAKAVNLIRHENIVNVLDLAKLPDRRPYIIMEFLDGAPLSTLIAERGPLPLGSLARLMGEVLSALGGAHEKGIVHRDLKPDNVFVTPHGRAKVLDFGIAKLQPEQSGRSAPTRDGSLMGTPHYMAPEQAQAQPVTPRTDVYAAGVILFEGACGRPPFSAGALYDLLRKQVEEPPPPPRSLRPDLPPAYEQVILRALAKDPRQRPDSARALYHELVAATRDLPEHAWAPLGEAENRLTVGMSSVPTPAGPTPAHQQGYAYAAPRTPPAYPTQPHPSASPTPAAAGQMVPQSPGPAPAPRSRALWIAAPLIVIAIAGVVTAASLAGSSDPEPEVTAAAEPEIDAAVDAVDVAIGDSVEIGDNVEIGGEAIAVAESADPPAADAGAPARGSMSVSGADAFDVSGFIPRAQSLARRVFDDAVLVRIDAGGVRPDGRADLTLDASFSVLYRFVSPSRARRPANLPLGVDHKPTCMFYVNVTGNGIDYYPLVGWKCDMALIGPPRCEARRVWSKAAAKGAPKQNAVAELGYWADRSGTGRWHFGIKDVVSSWIPDDC